METKKLDKKRVKIGLVYDMHAHEDGAYSLDMWIRSKLRTFKCTREVHDYMADGLYGHYPSASEMFYMPVFDETGTIVQLMQADHFQNEKACMVDTSFGLGTYAMMRYQITDQTPRVGEFFTLDGNVIRMADDFNEKKDKLVYLEYEGAIPEPRSGMMFRMAEDYDIYTWDWADATAPFNDKCTAEYAKAHNFVTHFELGKPEDLTKGYWIWFGSLRGDDSVIDTVCCFLNKAPGWEFL